MKGKQDIVTKSEKKRFWGATVKLLTYVAKRERREPLLIAFML